MKTMKTNQEKVKEFQIASGQRVDGSLSLNESILRKALIEEEIKELIEAVITGDKVAQLDALCDILYVNYGTANYLCVNITKVKVSKNTDPSPYEITEGLFLLSKLDTTSVQDIHNITKILARLLDLDEVLQEGFDRVHDSNMTKVVDGKVLRGENGKILKPDTFVPVNLYDLVEVDKLNLIDNFLLHNSGFQQEEREMIMELLCENLENWEYNE